MARRRRKVLRGAALLRARLRAARRRARRRAAIRRARRLAALRRAWREAARRRRRRLRRPRPKPALAPPSPVTLGLEVEAYAISIPDHRISREIVRPRRGAVEVGEHFTRDTSIGIEYASPAFRTVREALFLTKAGLRKYLRRQDRPDPRRVRRKSVCLVGGWRDRFAGAHLHVSLMKRGRIRLDLRTARRIAAHVHDQIPFLIALTANSPVWAEAVTSRASNRLLRGGDEYCYAIRRRHLDRDHYAEMNFNAPPVAKAPTLEIRVCDSNLPEYLAAALAVVKAVTLRCLDGRRPANVLRHDRYLEARADAARRGVRARLWWHHRRVTVREYVDLFFRAHAKECARMDIPEDVIDVFRWLRRGWNGAEIVRAAARNAGRSVGRHHLWQKRFARRYAAAIEGLLAGGSLARFAEALGVRLPAPLPFPAEPR